MNIILCSSFCKIKGCLSGFTLLVGFVRALSIMFPYLVIMPIFWLHNVCLLDADRVFVVWHLRVCTCHLSVTAENISSVLADCLIVSFLLLLLHLPLGSELFFFASPIVVSASFVMVG